MSSDPLLTAAVIGLTSSASECCLGAADAAICACEGTAFPQVISNPPGLTSIAYRVGDYTSFRHALLRALPGETELSANGTPIWRPAPTGDLALQIVEWWAYLSDILTFYNERIANESYLNTAQLPASVHALIRLLGYRPQPGIGATGTLAARVIGSKPPVLPAGFPVQSKPGPGQQPQIFELASQTALTLPDSVAAVPPASSQLGQGSALVQGVITSVKVGDTLLLLSHNWDGSNANYAFGTVASVAQEKDPSGKANTRINLNLLTNYPDFPANAVAANYTLLKSSQTAHAYQFATNASDVLANISDIIFQVGLSFQPQVASLRSAGVTRTHLVKRAGGFGRFGLGQNEGTIHLDSLARQIKAGDPILFRDPSSTTTIPQLLSVVSYSEQIYYANNPGTPSVAPPSTQANPVVGIPILHSVLTFTPQVASAWDLTTLVIDYAWRPVGTLIDTPATSFDGSATTLTAVPPATFPALSNAPVVVVGSAGDGLSVKATVASNQPATMTVGDLPASPPTLPAPLQVLFNQLPVTRGKTVPSEVLGSGDASQAGQEFVLQNSPLTYLTDLPGISGDGYSSTLRVWVDGVEWQEVRSLYGQKPGAKVFVTREDDQARTHVRFGDGVTGARLSTGVNNVIASYRYGSGASAPAAGSLTVILQPVPGLASILNPVPVGGGSDPDPPARIRVDAPRSVLTFGRAVSADDYAVIAAGAPGVTRAKGSFGFDGPSQRARITIYVSGDASAVSTATERIAGAADPNRPFKVVAATPVPIRIAATIVVDPTRIAADVLTAVRSALLDPDTGLFAPSSMGIGQPLYDSEFYAACSQVAGVVAVRDLAIVVRPSHFVPEFIIKGRRPCQCRHRSDPTESGFFNLDPGDLSLTPEVADGNSGS
jgi:hypothetical protein